MGHYHSKIGFIDNFDVIASDPIGPWYRLTLFR